MNKLAYGLYAIGFAILIKSGFRGNIEITIAGLLAIVGAFLIQSYFKE